MATQEENKDTPIEVLARGTGEMEDKNGRSFQFPCTPVFFGAFREDGDTPRDAMVLSWLLYRMRGYTELDNLAVEFNKYSVVHETGMRWRSIIAALDVLESIGLIRYYTTPVGRDVAVYVGIEGEAIVAFLAEKHAVNPESRMYF